MQQASQQGLNALYKASSAAAFLIVAGMCIHLFNAGYYEPQVLGFVDKAKDYGDMAKIENAIGSWAFTSSGITHMVVGVALAVLGLGLSRLAEHTHPIAAQFILLAAVTGGLGFLLTGISDIPATKYGQLLRELNPDYNTNILLMTTMIRGLVNTLAIFGLGMLAALTGYYTLSSHAFPKWYGYFCFLLAFPGVMCLVNPVMGFSYLAIAPVWALALGLFMRKKVIV